MSEMDLALLVLWGFMIFAQVYVTIARMVSWTTEQMRDLWRGDDDA